MKFLVDAQLPTRLVRQLVAAGHDAIHTSELPDGNRSSDHQIATRADFDDRIVITKDRDFRDSHLLVMSPARLLVVTTGNISNDELLALFDTNLALIVGALTDARYVEIGPDTLVSHQDRH